MSNRRAAILVELGRFGHFVGSAARKLNRHRLFNRVPGRFLERLAGLADHRLARDHLGYIETRTKAPHQGAKRHISHAGHWGQNDGHLDGDRANLDRFETVHVLPKI
jgi:hypothetical protein